MGKSRKEKKSENKNSRAPLSKKIRFEVFKRDSFTCQYCGRTAPDVILHVDHIHPIFNGGDNEIINLITSCQPCNLGKGKRELDDDSIIKKQKAQLEQLNERRLQLGMMLEWREELSKFEAEKAEKILEIFESKTNHGLKRPFDAFLLKTVQKWIKDFTFEKVLNALDISLNQYLIRDGVDSFEFESINKSFQYIPRIARVRSKGNDGDLYYIRGILRNRLQYVNEALCMKILKDARERGISVEQLKEIARDVGNWTQFRNAVEEAIEELE